MTDQRAAPVPNDQPYASPMVGRLSPAMWLVTIGSVMLGIWALAFAQRYSLTEYGHKPYQSIATLSHMSAESGALYIFGFLALFGLYGSGLRQVTRLRGRSAFIGVLGFAIAFNVALLPMYTVDGADVYDYIMRGRMAAVYGLNPLLDTPEKAASDPFYPFAAWHETTSAYGPAWELMAAAASRLAGDDPFANVIAYKLLAVFGYVATTLLIGLILRRTAPQRTLVGMYLFAWNPLVVYITGGLGRNDLIMVALMAGSIYCLTRRWYVASTVVALLGALVKFIPLLLIPAIAVVALHELSGRLRVQYIVSSVLLGMLLVMFCYGLFGAGLQSIHLERRARMYTGSVATLARQAFIPLLDHKASDSAGVETPITNAVVGSTGWVLFGLFYLYRLSRLWRNPSGAIRMMAAILVAYLLIASAWFQPWYAIWGVTLAVLLDDTPLRRLTLAFSYLVTWQLFLYNYVTLRPDGWMALPWRDLIPVAVVMGVAWAYGAWLWFASRMRGEALITDAARL